MVWTVAARENERDRGLTNTLVRRVRSFQGRTLETLSVRSPLNYVQGPVNVSQSSLSSIIHNSLSIFATPRILVIKLRNPVGFSCIKSMLKDQLFELSGLQFDNWLFGPEKFSGHSRNRLQDLNLESQLFKLQSKLYFEPAKLIWPNNVFGNRKCLSVLGVFNPSMCLGTVKSELDAQKWSIPLWYNIASISAVYPFIASFC